MLTADLGHRLPVMVLKQVVYPFMIQKLSGTQLTKKDITEQEGKNVIYKNRYAFAQDH